MELLEKLELLADAAKYDVACTSSGVKRSYQQGRVGNTTSAINGCCHSFSADGRCITLLKVLMSNYCIYDCKYCINRSSSEVRRTAFTPRELAELTIGFYRRNYIEGLFLSSGVLKNADYTMERMIQCLSLLRGEYRFNGYIHAKAIPGAAPELVQQLGLLADRLSVNIELPSEQALKMLCPEKSKASIFKPMGRIADTLQENRYDLTRYRHTPRFAPAGQSTQMIIGATPEDDRHILHLSQSLYRKYHLKRVFYSAYIPVTEHALLPAKGSNPPLLREHRLYQADWLLRFYGFTAEELLDEACPNFDPALDPKCSWALHHLEQFPIEVSTADYEMLLRVPGIGTVCARRILSARRTCRLDFDVLKKLRVVLKRAQYFITCNGKMAAGIRFREESVRRTLTMLEAKELPGEAGEQLSLFPAETERKLAP